MSHIAVVAHARKSLGGGLPELRRLLAARGVEVEWYEVLKSKRVPGAVERALDGGANRVVAWGGDGTVQRCVDALAGSDVELAILPAGTANLLATNLGIPTQLPEALDIALSGTVRRMDVARANGEHFAVMAGAGFDALMIRDADAGLKDRLGRAAYLWTGTRHLDMEPVTATIKIDRTLVHEGPVACLLVGNVGSLFAGVEAFDGASPFDGTVEVGVVTAQGRVQWLRTLGRLATGTSEASPFVDVVRGSRIRVRFSGKFPYELDGGARGRTRRLRIDVRPGALRIVTPTVGAEQTDAGKAVEEVRAAAS